MQISVFYMYMYMSDHWCSGNIIVTLSFYMYMNITFENHFQTTNFNDYMYVVLVTHFTATRLL